MEGRVARPGMEMGDGRARGAGGIVDCKVAAAQTLWLHLIASILQTEFVPPLQLRVIQASRLLARSRSQANVANDDQSCFACFARLSQPITAAAAGDHMRFAVTGNGAAYLSRLWRGYCRPVAVCASGDLGINFAIMGMVVV